METLTQTTTTERQALTTAPCIKCGAEVRQFEWPSAEDQAVWGIQCRDCLRRFING